MPAHDASAIPPPLALLAEVTHRCPLHCPYCSNPRELTAAAAELPTEVWARVFREAAALGALQLHLSGGEPAARSDLEALVAAAHDAGLYVNLITSGLGLSAERLARLKGAGLDHVQLSLQDSDAATADRIAGTVGAHARKLALAAEIRRLGLPLTVNVVLHRANIAHAAALIDLALALGAHRLELAHAQYYGWALLNRAALLPSRAEVAAVAELVEARRAALRGRLRIDYVAPDYFARRPKACMGGWGQRFLMVTPAGRILPCHAAETIPGLTFPQVTETSLRAAWQESEAFAAYRGTAWMPEPCRSCGEREIDWGGCRCQALALAGDAAATDPVCDKSSLHAIFNGMIAEALGPPDYRYRAMSR